MRANNSSDTQVSGSAPTAALCALCSVLSKLMTGLRMHHATTAASVRQWLNIQWLDSSAKTY